MDETEMMGLMEKTVRTVWMEDPEYKDRQVNPEYLVTSLKVLLVLEVNIKYRDRDCIGPKAGIYWETCVILFYNATVLKSYQC